MLNLSVAVAAATAAVPVQLECHFASAGGRRGWILILEEKERGVFDLENPAPAQPAGSAPEDVLTTQASELPFGLAKPRSTRKPRQTPFTPKAKGSADFPGVCSVSQFQAGGRPSLQRRT